MVVGRRFKRALTFRNPSARGPAEEEPPQTKPKVQRDSGWLIKALGGPHKRVQPSESDKAATAAAAAAAAAADADIDCSTARAAQPLAFGWLRRPFSRWDSSKLSQDSSAAAAVEQADGAGLSSAGPSLAASSASSVAEPAEQAQDCQAPTAAGGEAQAAADGAADPAPEVESASTATPTSEASSWPAPPSPPALSPAWAHLAPSPAQPESPGWGGLRQQHSHQPAADGRSHHVSLPRLGGSTRLGVHEAVPSDAAGQGRGLRRRDSQQSLPLLPGSSRGSSQAERLLLLPRSQSHLLREPAVPRPQPQRQPRASEEQQQAAKDPNPLPLSLHTNWLYHARGGVEAELATARAELAAARKLAAQQARQLSREAQELEQLHRSLPEAKRQLVIVEERLQASTARLEQARGQRADQQVEAAAQLASLQRQLAAALPACCRVLEGARAGLRAAEEEQAVAQAQLAQAEAAAEAWRKYHGRMVCLHRPGPRKDGRRSDKGRAARAPYWHGTATALSGLPCQASCKAVA